MDAFLKYAYQDLGLIFKAFISIFASIFDFLNTLLNFPMRMKIIQAYAEDFNVPSWILVAIVNLLLIAVVACAVFFLIKLIRRLFRFRIPVKEYDRMKDEVAKLNREVFKLNYEKDKILAMKVAEMGMTPNDKLLDIENEANRMLGDENKGENAENHENSAETDNQQEEQEEYIPGTRNTVDGPPVAPETSRFFRLTTIDNDYKTEYSAPEYDNDITLEEFCDRWRNFAASRLRLYYDISIMRFFVASMGASRMMILQGISGTGKTSLPYSFGKYLQLDSTIDAVQPAWRDRTDLFGY